MRGDDDGGVRLTIAVGTLIGVLLFAAAMAVLELRTEGAIALATATCIAAGVLLAFGGRALLR